MSSGQELRDIAQAARLFYWLTLAALAVALVAGVYVLSHRHMNHVREADRARMLCYERATIEGGGDPSAMRAWLNHCDAIG